MIEVPIDSVYEDPANARRHPQKNLEAIKASLRHFGQVEPLVVQRSTGKVIGGNGRLTAMKELGWETIKVNYVDVDDAKAAALGIALNRTAELAEWDQESLADVLAGLDSGDQEINSILDELARQEKLPGSPEFEYGGGDQSEMLQDKFQIIVECVSESQQTNLLNKLSTEGFQCRALVS